MMTSRRGTRITPHGDADLTLQKPADQGARWHVFSTCSGRLSVSGRKDLITRVNGRTLRPSTLAERRLLLSLGVECLRVPRRLNPYTVARRIRRLARCETPEHTFLRKLIDAGKKRVPEDIPRPSPDLDLPEPIELPPMVMTHDQAA